jgi:protoporphyrinogen oxidase
MTTDNQPSVIIVGGGLSGLSAAAIGHTVTLFEKANAPGGRARTKRQQGFSFNQGAHGLYLNGPAEKLLRELGVSYPGSEPDSANYLAFEHGKLHALPTGIASMLGTTLLKPGAKFELIRIFAALKQIKRENLYTMILHDWLEKAGTAPSGAGVFAGRDPSDNLCQRVGTTFG